MDKIVYGFHAIEESLKKGSGRKCLKLAASSSRITRLQDLAKRSSCTVEKVSRDELDSYASPEEHRGAVLIVEELGREQRKSKRSDDPLKDLVQREGDALVLILDGITDPQNLGALMRSADQFAVDLLVLPERRSASDGAVVRKVSAGASVHVPKLKVPNLVRVIEQLKKGGFWVYAADMDGTASWGTDLKGKVALVLGAEGRGVGQLVKKSCDAVVSIPMKGHIDSLNVSVAGGVLLYEVRRQQWSGNS